MATTEPTINDALAAVLMETRSLWRYKGVVKSENIDVLKGSGKKPDILINEPNVSPVIVETEILPAQTVESDAKERLGEHLMRSGTRILSSLAVRLPVRLRDLSGQPLKDEILTASDLDVALFTGESPASFVRWPRNGWMKANVTDLSMFVQSATVPPAVVEEAANKLVEGVSGAAAFLEGMAIAHPGAMSKICEELRQQDSEQTRRMAATILANALVFHESLARGEGDLYEVRTLDELRSDRGGVNKGDTLEDWKRILRVNYWPIFDIARRILEVIPADTSRPLLERLVTTATELVANHMMQSHDLTGAVFQRLIADRKFLAAYYTNPSSAALLAGLAIDQFTAPNDGSWSKESDVTSLRIADFACGTGTLLSAAYRRVSQLHEAFGGNAETIHPEMMSNALVGCDVLPAAAHLTASMLASAHPTVTYKGSSVMAVGFGPRPEGGFALGSLDLLDLQRPIDIVAITAKTIEGTGEREHEVWEVIPHWSYDMVIMNPPFTRDTNHEAARANVVNPMFAAFGMTDEQQREMARASARLLRGTSAHGNAGEASAFLVLADRKLKVGGTLAMVMPISLMLGDSWENSRGLLRKSYDDLVLVSISGAGRKNDMAFSADTSIAECLVVGRKAEQSIRWHRATFIVLYERPSSTMTGSSIASQIHKLKEGKLRKLEQGPVGGSLLHFGDDVIGYALDAPVPQEGPWNLARIGDCALAQLAYQMSHNSLVWLPGTPKKSAIPVSITTVSKVGKVGPVDRDINGNTPDGGIRGPFNVEPLKTQAAPTYPILWWHDANRERCMQFEADSEGIIRQGANPAEEAMVGKKVARVWATASHCHFNRDFLFSSESTGMQFTSEKSIGGRAWPSIALSSIEQEKALVLWSNSSLGLLLRWWHSNKQQPGRGSIGVSTLASLPVLDVTKLSGEALARMVAIFDDMKHKELRPVNEIDQDVIRAEIDTRLAMEVLGLPPELAAPDGPLELLRQKLALEPSIAGSKLTQRE
ncbi:MAG TPA: hypothetical protein VMV76_02210 [Dehalococcoidia bacterium]|nr:hypothetical protein [Dehalococcoidia bacterium]